MPRTRPLESSLLNPWVFSRSSSCAGPSEPLRPGPDAEDEVAGVIEPMFFFRSSSCAGPSEPPRPAEWVPPVVPNSRTPGARTSRTLVPTRLPCECLSVRFFPGTLTPEPLGARTPRTPVPTRLPCECLSVPFFSPGTLTPEPPGARTPRTLVPTRLP